MRFRLPLIVLSSALLLAGCSSAEKRIYAACVKQNGFSAPGATADSSTIDKQCSCFSKNLKNSLPDDQLGKVADGMDAKDRQDSMKDLPQATKMSVMSAAKSCVVS